MYLQTKKITRKKETIMTNPVASIYEELYNEQSSRSIDLAGELGGMAFVAAELLLRLQADRLDTYAGQKAIEEMEEVLRKYYQGTGKDSPFARPWAKLEFDKEAV